MKTIPLVSGLFQPERSGLRLDDYDYPLPESAIARYPLPERDQSRMLTLNRATGEIRHARFADLPDLLTPNDLMVLNNTKVLPARFIGHRRGHTGRVEVLLLYPALEAETAVHPDQAAPVWDALMRPIRKLKPGTIIDFPDTRACMEVLAIGERGLGQVRIHPEEYGDLATLMERVGKMPIPPYLGREAEESDTHRYQTVYSRVPGAQAAPTAGLHFTDTVLRRLTERGIRTAEVTLSVSSGTFRPVEADNITEHPMDAESYRLPEETAHAIRETREKNGRVLAIGTTSAKTLETVASQYPGEIRADSGWSRLFIYPGFSFQVTDMLLTNFHLPKSTLLMLISAFAGRENIAAAYREALEKNYRFYSYGDCMLIY